ncbi:hypothetical protein C1X65_21185 [Pseudomonas sp. FW305-70]|nr:hypothetical protein C1X65_21185 [Pseudomonas sp. FW305-70]
MPWFFHDVGASLLAMVVNDYAGALDKCGALESIASKLAPTVSCREPFLCPQSESGRRIKARRTASSSKHRCRCGRWRRTRHRPG